MPCYITRTGSFLPGPPVPNESIEQFLGSLDGEAEVKKQILGMNGITSRHYAQQENQTSTHSVYELGALAIQDCLQNVRTPSPIGMLAAGTTFAPLSGPGIGSLLHSQAQKMGLLPQPLEIASHSGICTSAAAAIVAGYRALELGIHQGCVCVGAEHASEILKSSVIHPIDDRTQHAQLRNSQWFMSVFLRFMLSDGAGAMLLESSPRGGQVSWKIDWTHSMSFANETPLCMKLDNSNRLLSQDVSILSRFLFPKGRKFVDDALVRHDEKLDSYQCVLPHLSSFFFRRKMERILSELSADPEHPVPYWTNLATAGNTGAASIFIMLDHYVKSHRSNHGDRILLFIPESGQFNFVLISLTAVVA